ncbi:MAG TPA: alpha/beta fold hydrolase [Gemmataceae bacterium]|nr:alpha/beta fold hydrolase [Gemmataceae bacterium]
MSVNLVQIWTADHLRLDGAFQTAPTPGAARLPIDAFCLVHGTGGNFYGSSLFDQLGQRLLDLGCSVLRINTRGHDGINTTATQTGGKRLGAAYELVDDCRKDLAAWMSWLRQHAGPRIGLIGHSLGAVKCLYAMAHKPDLAAQLVIALSPPRLSYSWFCSSPEGPKFLESYAEADRGVNDGRPAALLEVKLPLPFVITAAGYVEKYGPDERYNYLRFLASVDCPVLVTLGSVECENNMAFRGAAEAIGELGHRQLAVAMIAGGDHFYTAVRPQLVDHVDAWLKATCI